MKTKILIAVAIGVIGNLLCLNYSTIYAKSDLAFKAKDGDIKISLNKTIDSDLDGVTNDRDKCPGTPFGVVVDADGCPVRIPPGSLVAYVL